MFRISSFQPISHSLTRCFAVSAREAANKLFTTLYNGLEVMRETNNPFHLMKTSLSLSINKGGPKSFVITLLQNDHLRLETPENHYNDYIYNPDDDAFENMEDGHNIVEAFTRDLMTDYQGCPTFYSVYDNKQVNRK